MPEVAALFSLGTTPGGCEFALAEILKVERPPLDVYFYYGEPAPNQPSSPEDILDILRRALLLSDHRVIPHCVANPWSLDQAYLAAVHLLRTVDAAGYRRIYLGITGGTKPMIAAVFHAAMSQLHGEVIPIYVQGIERQSLEFIASPRTRDAVTVDKVLAAARRNALSVAAALAEDLPSAGREGFLRHGVQLLAAWDDFNYKYVGDQLAKHAQQCYRLSITPELAPFADTIRRLGAVAAEVKSIAAVYASPERFSDQKLRPDWVERVSTSGRWLPADALANAHRRAGEGRYTDAVLRAYRAVEIAIHNRLFALGVHPSDLDWDREPLRACRTEWPSSSDLPKTVSLDSGFRLLELLGGEDLEPLAPHLRGLQSARNHSYLEHGYQRINENTWQSCFESARTLCRRVLVDADDLESRVVELRMTF